MRATVVLGLVGSVAILVMLFELLRRKHLREKYAVLWIAISFLTLLTAIFPQILFGLSDLIGVQVPANLLFFIASLLLFAISVHHSYELGRLEDRTRALAEEIALLRVELAHNEESDDASR